MVSASRWNLAEWESEVFLGLPLSISFSNNFLQAKPTWKCQGYLTSLWLQMNFAFWALDLSMFVSILNSKSIPLKIATPNFCLWHLSPLNLENVCLSNLALYALLTNPSQFALDFVHGSTFPLWFVYSPLSSCSWQMTSQTLWDTLLPNRAANRQIGKSSEPKQLRWDSWTIQHGASKENYCFLKAWNQSRK